MLSNSAPSNSAEILAAKVSKNARGETLLYRLFLHRTMIEKKKYPLVLFLHGGGGRGTDNIKQIDGGIGYLIDFFTGSEAQYQLSKFRCRAAVTDAGRLD